MGLFLPRRRPSGPVRAAGAAGRDLAAFYYLPLGSPNGAAFWDAVTGLQGDDESGQTIAHTPNGRGLKYNGSARAIQPNFANPKGVTADTTTVIARVKLTTKAGSTLGMVAEYRNGGSGRGGAGIGFNTSGNAMGGQGTSGGFKAGVDSVDWTGIWVTIGGGAETSGTPSGQLFVNGIYQGADGGGDVSGSSAPTAVYLGRDQTGYFSGFTGEIEWVAVFNKILSKAEHLAWARDPYGMALGREPISYSYQASASPNVAAGVYYYKMIGGM